MSQPGPYKDGRYYDVDFPVGEGKTDYEKYIRTQELLSLQVEPGKAASNQEMLFQVTHQTSELWMKLMLDELDKVFYHLEKDEILLAVRCFRLVNSLQHTLLFAVDSLGQHLSIIEYRSIRLALGQGSGLESPGFNRLLDKTPHLWDAFMAVLDRRDVSLRDVYEDYRRHIELHTLAECMMDYDDLFHKWRSHHFDMVARTIGVDSNSLKGIATRVLSKGAMHRFFPELLAIRSQITNESSVAYGGKPLA